MIQTNTYMSRALLQALCALVFAFAVACLSTLAPTPALAADTIPIPLTVENTVTGSPTTDETFTFVLEAETAGAPLPSSSEVSITGSGSASFGDINFTQAGQYQYRLYERAGTTAGYVYDTTVYHVLVDASWQGGTLITQVVAWKGDTRSDATKVSKLEFENKYTLASFTVRVLWEADTAASRPSSVTLKLCKNGVLFDTRTVSAASGWIYTWVGLDANVTYTLEEDSVPSGYGVSVTFSANDNAAGGTFVVTNTLQSAGGSIIDQLVQTGDALSVQALATVLGIALLLCLAGVVIARRAR